MKLTHFERLTEDQKRALACGDLDPEDLDLDLTLDERLTLKRKLKVWAERNL
jgi:hypothetical protein